VCIHCIQHEKTTIDWDALEREFHQIVEQHRGRGKKYDFMVPLSGGKDSSFVLYYLTKVCKARVLAFTWDSGLIREAAWQNIKATTKALGVDHQVFTFADQKTMQSFHRANFKAFGTICYCVVYYYLAAIPAAFELDIPLIVTGFSEGQRDKDHSFRLPQNQECVKQAQKLHKDWSNLFSMSLKKYEPQHATEILHKIMGPLGACVNKEKKNDWPKFLPLANYMNWLKRPDLFEVMKKEINYQKAADQISHTSCDIESVRGYQEHMRNANGIDTLENEISIFVRDGIMTREEALEELETLGHGQKPVKEIEAYAQFLGITLEEFDRHTLTTPAEESSVMQKLSSHIMDGIRDVYRAKLRKSARWVLGLK
jgi:3'-phosphoadenosine 5'-phosphosulfate sulfotransferase (PAPS reductase)/FAD synthetase